VGIGAIAAVGGYFIGKLAGAEEAEEQRHYESRANPAATARHFTDDPDDLKKGHDEVRECGICFREFEDVKANNEEIHTTPCGHIFCKHCLEHSLRNKPECPFCRSRVEPDQTLRIYI
jgi:hypothetical protein